MKLFYSIFSGIIYEVFDQEVPNLDEGQVPLKQRPKPSCSTCYGRGYNSHDKAKGIYPICRCMRKCLQDGYKPVQVRILPNIA